MSSVAFLTDELGAVLYPLTIWPRRLFLETAYRNLNIPELRGVWGAALHRLNRSVYHEVFAPRTAAAAPGYVLRPAPPLMDGLPALEWLLIGRSYLHDQVLRRAWDVALAQGLGRQRCPALIRRLVTLDPEGRQRPTSVPWSLNQLAWPLAGDPARTPCVLEFPAPVRLLRHGQLVQQPTLTDIIIACARRLVPYLPPQPLAALHRLHQLLLDEAQTHASYWEGERLDFERYSGRQKNEVLMHGVTGSLHLPAGPGPLWPLLSAASWLHIGKGTVFGLGQILIRPGRDCLTASERGQNPRLHEMLA